MAINNAILNCARVDMWFMGHNSAHTKLTPDKQITTHCQQEIASINFRREFLLAHTCENAPWVQLLIWDFLSLKSN